MDTEPIILTMKTYNRLFQKICSFENLLSAARKAQRGKRFQDSVAHFNFHLEKELYGLQAELQTQTYCPGPYHEFHVYEPKLRIRDGTDFLGYQVFPTHRRLRIARVGMPPR